MSKDCSKEADVCDDFVLSTYEYYSVDMVAELLMPTGFLIDKSTRYAGSFERYVFFYGNKDEIYTKQEIDFISNVDDIVIFTEFRKEIRRGVMPCKVVVTRNSRFDAVDFSIAFTKIMNKACDGFNICVIFSQEGIIFTCRAYESTANNYYISDIVKNYEQLEKLYDDLMYSPNYNGFIEFYSYVSDSIRFKTMLADYLSKNRNIYRSVYTYLDALWGIEREFGVSCATEIERCFWGLEGQCEDAYAKRVADAEERLFRIESSRINTMEMLFEAEEMEKLASETEQRNESMIMQDAIGLEKNSEEIDTQTKALLDDPEAVIKLLKKKRGI